MTDRFDERLRFEAMIANSADLVLLLRDGLVEWVAPGVTELLGWAPADVVGSPGDQLIHPGDRSRLAHTGSGNAADGLTRLHPRYPKRGGGFIWCEARAARVREALGNVVVVSLREDTALMASEEARDRSDHRYRLIAENTADIGYTTDRMHRFN